VREDAPCFFKPVIRFTIGRGRWIDIP
jgi:hypothetical protein